MHRSGKRTRPLKSLFTSRNSPHTTKQAGPTHRDYFGSYGLTSEEDLSRMAMDVTTTVHTLLRCAGEDKEEAFWPHGLMAAGHLLEWAQEYLAWYGLQGDKEVQENAEKWEATARAGRSQDHG